MAKDISDVRTILAHEAHLLKCKYPFLKNQDLIGALVMLFSVTGLVVFSTLFVLNLAPWWLVIPFNAFFLSLVHELEHDLIHNMYFKKNRLGYALMMNLCWILKPNIISPWFRKDIHLHHHKMSGHPSDIEERGITNGSPYGFKRLLRMADPLLAIILSPVSTYSAARQYTKYRMLPNTLRSFSLTSSLP